MRKVFEDRLALIQSHLANGVTGRDHERGYSIDPAKCSVFNPDTPEIYESALPQDFGFVGNPGVKNPEIEKFLARIGPSINKSKSCPYYRLDNKSVYMPPFARYLSPDNYYSDALHEFVHHARHLSGHFGIGGKTTCFKMIIEEIVAQVGAELLMAKFGLDTSEKSAAYIDAHGQELCKALGFSYFQASLPPYVKRLVDVAIDDAVKSAVVAVEELERIVENSQ